MIAVSAPGLGRSIQRRQSYRMGSRSRKKNTKGGAAAILFRLFLCLGLIILLFLAFGTKLFARWLPSSEKKDLSEWFEVEGDEIRLYLDGQMEAEQTGLYRFDHVYLPLSYVRGQVNMRFFENSDKTVSMTLPGEEQLFDAHSYENGAPVLLSEGGDSYILLDTVEKYTSLEDMSYTGENDGPYRVFLYRGGSEGSYAYARKKSAVRTRMSQTAPILDTPAKDERVLLFDQKDEWCRVLTDAGVIGYMPARDLENTESFTRPDTWTMPGASHYHMDEKVVMGWHSLVGTAANEYLESLVSNTGGALNVVSPTWIQISDADGSFENYATEDYVEKAHAAGIQVWAAVDNFNQPGGLQDFSTGAFFSDREKRADFIRRLVAEVQRFHIDGINLDFEGISAEAGPAYVQMIRELSNVCRDTGIVLSVDNYVPYTYNSHYELGEQALYADYIVIMGYDEHTGKDVGSVSSQPWFEDGILRALDEVPAEQLIGAVPFYTRRWEISGTGVSSYSTGMMEADRYAADHGISLSWNEECGQFYGELREGAVTTKIWMEDITSLTLKSDFLKSYDPAGIAAWRLGYEPASVWEVLDWNGKRRETGDIAESEANDGNQDNQTE